MKLNIGENIRSCRRKMNLTQEQLADKLGVSFQSVSRWENDLTYPDMELLPVLSKIFGVTTDELLGVPETKKEQAEFELLKELTELSNREDASAERIIEIIREIRLSFLSTFSISHMLWSVNKKMYFRFPEILPEIRLTMEQALESEELDILDKHYVIELMTEIEDEERIEKFLERYTSLEDMSRTALLHRRYQIRGNAEKFEPVRQTELYRRIDSLIGVDNLWINFLRPRDLMNTLAARKLQIDFFHKLCGQTPDKAHPVSADGKLDFWVQERIWIGLNLSSCLSASGEIEEAFTVLEDVVSLLEKGMEITEPVELRCSSPFLKDIVFTASEGWNNIELNYFLDKKQARIIYIGNNDGEYYCLCPPKY